MKNHSYKIKHDFLFDYDESSPVSIKRCAPLCETHNVNLSSILSARDIDSFWKLIDNTNRPVLIIDDIGKCRNPAAEKYKGFVIQCASQKLVKNNIDVYVN